MTEQPLTSPEELWQLLDEFLGVNLVENPLRKLALGVGLNMERRRLITRLLDNVEAVCRDPNLLAHWLELRKVYRKIEEALAAPNEDELRTFAAKRIFRAEQVEAETQMGMEIGHVATKDTW